MKTQHRNHYTQISLSSSNPNDQELTKTFRLPVFPLSKAMLFPTQILNLNLYEPRYLALAKDVLFSSTGTSDEENNPIFGAIFSHTSPRIVIPDSTTSSNNAEYTNTRRNNPITPLFQKDDIGVICSVLYSNVILNNQNETEKIQIQAIGIGRFRIEEIMQTGYKDKNDFILVEASSIVDEYDDLNHSIQDVSNLEQKLYETVLDVDKSFIDKLIWENKRRKKSRRGGTLKDVGDNPEENKNDNSDLSILHQLAPGCQTIPSVFNQAYSNRFFPDITVDKYEWKRRQLFSFAVASNFVFGKPPDEMLTLLRMTSTAERFTYLKKTIEDGSWLTVKAFKT